MNLATDEVVADADVTFVVICHEKGRPVALDGALREALGGDPE